MIRIIKTISDDLTLGVWEINENIESLKKELSEEEAKAVANYHPQKLAEYITSRWLIQEMCAYIGLPFSGMTKDDHGKPFFVNSTYHLSLSHSFPMVAAVVHKSLPCGIDIEKPREQLIRIKRKFLSPAEQIVCGDNLEKLCLYWCAKEATYKINGRKNLSFAESIAIMPNDNNRLLSTLQIDGNEKTIGLFVEKMERYLLVYGYGTL